MSIFQFKFSTDEDARQGMASDGGMLKDSRVKLYLSSRTEMQKIIEETRQQHLAMQGAASGGSNMAPTSAVQRPFTGGPFAPSAAPAAHSNPPISGPPGLRATSSTSGSNFHMHMDPSQGHPGGYDHQMYQQPQLQSHQPYNPSQNMLAGGGQNPVHAGGFPPHMNPSQTYAPHLPQGGPHIPQHFGPRMREVIEEPPLLPYGGGQQMLHGPGGDMQDVYAHGGPQRFDQNRRNSRDTPPDVQDRNRDMGRAGYRSKERSRRDRQDRDKERGSDMGRRGRRSRSRSGSRGRGRDRRRRSRSDSRERARNSRDRDRDRKLSKSGLLPTPAEELEANQQNENVPDTSVQLRLLTGDLTYRDIRDYLSGINVPNTCIKMINALDGYRFGLAYIRFTSNEDKLKALSRHNGKENLSQFYS